MQKALESRVASGNAPAQDNTPRVPSRKRWGKQLQRERQTIAAMIACFCQGQHGGGASLCPECQGLLDYASHRLERCPFGDNKPNCAKCPIHCYQSERRDQVKAVMRYAGPRLARRHPLSALRHWLRGLRKTPPRSGPVRPR